MNTIILDEDSRDFLCWRIGSGGSVEIYDIAVGSERGVGKGRRLIEELKKQVDPNTKLIFVIARSSNIIAHQFYTAIGFRLIAVLGNFYDDNSSDAFMFGLNL
jgi:ribosomal protein S18 acetylase RimI-like enzyme